MNDNIQEQMLAYLKRGFSVIPIGRNKRPLIDSWKEFQSRKPTRAEIENWCATLQPVGIGIITGKISGIAVLDLDEGADTAGLALPPTPCVKTGGNGWHHYYKYPADGPLKSINGFRTKMDFKADGGYIIAPPSLHRSGKRYEWAVSLDDASLAQVPEWLFEAINPKGSEWKDWSKITAGVAEGSRNDTAAVYIGKLLHGLSEKDWENVGWGSVIAWNDKNSPPLSQAELRRVFDSIAKREQEKTNGDMPEHYETLLHAVPKDTPKEKILQELQPLLEALAFGKDLASAELYIRNKVKSELGLTTQDTGSILKRFKEIRIPIVKKLEAEKQKVEQAKSEPVSTEEERRVAEQILKSTTLLHDVLKMVKKLGVVGEEKNILLHYIIFTSRNLQNPLSATVKGDSSSGKSFTLLTTLKLFPKSAFIDLTDATPQSFYYCPDDYFKHKIIVIFEKHGGERADYAIRTLQSEGKLKIQVTVKNPESGQFEAQLIEKEGPTGFVTTTTASLIHAENDTRNISMFPDQSSEQTGRIYESVDARYLGFRSISDNELKPWHHAQLAFEQLPVHIPYVKSFRKYFPKNIVRTRRDYGHFLAIIETVAFLHQKQRERIELYGQTYIQATLADAYIAKIIVEESLLKSIYELPEKTIEVIKTARELVEEIQDKQQETGEAVTFTITQLAKKINWDRDTVAKWMKPASKKGYLTIVVEGKGARGAEYKLEAKELPDDSFLPSIEQLKQDNPTERTDGIYDPLTGELKRMTTNVDAICTDAPTALEQGKNSRVQNAVTIDFNGGSNGIGASVEKLIRTDAIAAQASGTPYQRRMLQDYLNFETNW